MSSEFEKCNWLWFLVAGVQDIRVIQHGRNDFTKMSDRSLVKCHVGIWDSSLYERQDIQFSEENSNWNCDLCWSRWDDPSGDGPWGCFGVGWLIWACQRSWGSFFWSSAAMMAQQFLSTDRSFCSSCSILQGHNLCWTGNILQALNHSVAKTFCIWLKVISILISFSIPPLFLSSRFECWCVFVRHIYFCKMKWIWFLTFTNCIVYFVRKSDFFFFVTDFHTVILSEIDWIMCTGLIC